MGKRTVKVSAEFVPLPGEAHQGLLFTDARTTLQQMVIDAADGTRTVEAIAHECGITKEECEKIILIFLNDGELRAATPNDIFKIVEDASASANPENIIHLIQYGLSLDASSLPLKQQLAKFYEKTARSHEACEIYHWLARQYQELARFGEALEASRNAARLQPGNWQIQDELAMICVLTGRNEEAARVWRGYARRLCGSGHYEEALDIIDQASKQLPGNDILLYAEAEILSAMSPEDAATSAEPPAPQTENQQSATATDGIEKQDTDSPVSPTPVTSPEEKVPATAPVDTKRAATAQAVMPSTLGATMPRPTPTTPQTKDRRWMNYAGYIIAGMVLLVLVLSAYDFQSRERMQQAAEQAETELAATANDPLYRKLLSARRVLDKLLAAKPFITIMGNAQYSKQLEWTKQFISESEKLLDTQRKQQHQIIDAWKKLADGSNLAKLKDLAQSEDVLSPEVITARQLYQQWLQETQQNELMRRKLLEALNNLTLSAPERFLAYDELWKISPEIFSKPYPMGAADLSLPVSFRIEATASDKSIASKPTQATAQDNWHIESSAFKVLINGKNYYRREIPLDTGNKLQLYHPGYRSNTEKEPPECYYTSIEQPFKAEMTYNVQRVNRWELKLPFKTKAIKFSGTEGKQRIIVAGDSQATIINTDDGSTVGDFIKPEKSSHINEIPNAISAAVTPQIDSAAGWYGYLNNAGHATFFKESKQLNSNMDILIHYISMFNGTLNNHHATALTWGTQQNAEVSAGVIRCLLIPESGERVNVLWEYPSQSSQAAEVGAPGGKPLFHKGYILVPDNEGRVHILLENGEFLASLQLPEMFSKSGHPVQFCPISSGSDVTETPAVLAIYPTSEKYNLIRIKLSLKPSLGDIKKLPIPGMVTSIIHEGSKRNKYAVYICGDNDKKWNFWKFANNELTLVHAVKHGDQPYAEINPQLTDFIAKHYSTGNASEVLNVLSVYENGLNAATLEISGSSLNRLAFSDGNTVGIWEFLKEIKNH